MLSCCQFQIQPPDVGSVFQLALSVQHFVMDVNRFKYPSINSYLIYLAISDPFPGFPFTNPNIDDANF